MSLIWDGAHACLDQRNGRWYLGVFVQYWPLFEVQISEREAQELIRRGYVIDAKLTEQPAVASAPQEPTK